MARDVVTTIRDLLEALGSFSPEEIADIFRKRGLTGILNDCSYCPVAEFLYRETGHRPVVDGKVVLVRQPAVVDGVAVLMWIEEIPLPENVQRFIRLFDDERFPDLIRREE